MIASKKTVKCLSSNIRWTSFNCNCILKHAINFMLITYMLIKSAQAHSADESKGLYMSTVEHQNTLADDIAEAEQGATNNQAHVRQKRLIWITDDGRLALPPGTTLTITPTIGLPLVRHPPEGFLSNMSISFPVTIDFDKLGLTDNQNPLGDIPPLFARSFSHDAGRMLGNYVAQYLHYRRKRDLSETIEQPELPERFKHVFHGGERILLYTMVEDLLANFGLDGKACLLRTICEVHSRDLQHYGIVGEIAKLFLTVSKSPFSDQVPEYLRAQEIGEGRLPPQECFPYYKNCPKTIFKVLQKNKYSETQRPEYQEQSVAKILKPTKIAKYKIPDNEITYYETM